LNISMMNVSGMMEGRKKDHTLSSSALCWAALPLVLMEYLFVLYLSYGDDLIIFFTAIVLPLLIEGLLIISYRRGRKEITRGSAAAPSLFQMSSLRALLLLWAVNYPYLIWCLIDLTMRGAS